jgi:hypothetical protein
MLVVGQPLDPIQRSAIINRLPRRHFAGLGCLTNCYAKQLCLVVRDKWKRRDVSIVVTGLTFLLKQTNNLIVKSDDVGIRTGRGAAVYVRQRKSGDD